MRVNYVVILIVIAALAVVYLYAQEPEPPEEDVSAERIAELVELIESMKGNWAMFNGEVGGTFLYNKNTGAVYKFYMSGAGTDDFTYGLQRATILNRSNIETPSAF